MAQDELDRECHFLLQYITEFKFPSRIPPELNSVDAVISYVYSEEAPGSVEAQYESIHGLLGEKIWLTGMGSCSLLRDFFFLLPLKNHVSTRVVYGVQ